MCVTQAKLVCHTKTLQIDHHSPDVANYKVAKADHTVHSISAPTHTLTNKNMTALTSKGQVAMASSQAQHNRA